MSAALDMSMFPNWPRLLSRSQAAAYLGVSENHFSEHVPVQAIRMGRRVLYDRTSLDAYVDQLGGKGSAADWASSCELG